MRRKPFRLAAASFPALALAAPSPAGFIEPDVVVLHALQDPDVPSAAGFGWAVADLKDINGDGVKDIITSNPLYSITGSPNRGRGYVFSGRTGALLLIWTGAGTNWQLGYSMADAGDVNNDGTNDIVLGAPTRNGQGAALIYSGVTGSVIRSHFGGAAGDQFGAAVAGLGDINGDSFSDVAIGAATNDTGASNGGRLYLYSGVNGALIRTHEGTGVNHELGHGVGNAGDLNHDGKNDYIVGARGTTPGDAGRAYVFSGADGSALLPTLLPNTLTAFDFGYYFTAGAGDVNNDGTNDLYVADFNDNAGVGSAYLFSGTDGALLHRFDGFAPLDGLGPGRGAGDVNGDGYDDIIIGLYSSNTGAFNAGGAVVYSGRDYSIIRTITPNMPNLQFGFDAMGIGDVNGDCALDFVISAAVGGVPGGSTVYVIAGTDRIVPGDADRSATVDFDDIVSILGLWGETYPSGTGPGDGNRDGVVDFDDIVAALAAWGATCPG